MKTLIFSVFLTFSLAPRPMAAEVRSSRPLISEGAKLRKDTSAFATVARIPENPVRIEHNCPLPDPSVESKLKAQIS